MIALLSQFFAPFLPYIVAAIAAIGGLWGYGKVKTRQGVQKERQRQATADAKAQSETIEKVLNETVSADPADDIRRRMRERARKP